MKRILLLLLGSALMPGHAFANEKHFSWLDIAVGVKGLSNVMRRGATLYDSYQLTPIVYVGLVDHKIQLFFNSVEYNDYIIEGTLRGRSKISTVSDKPLFITTGNPLSIRNSRQSSLEWTNTVELFLPNATKYWFGVDLRVAQDLIAHGGTYAELVPRLTIARLFLENGKPLILPQLYASLGWGTGGHNRYQYGASATGGFNNLGWGILLAMPSRIDTAFWVFQAGWYSVLGDTNRMGNLLAGKSQGFHLNATFAVGVY